MLWWIGYRNRKSRSPEKHGKTSLEIPLEHCSRNDAQRKSFQFYAYVKPSQSALAGVSLWICLADSFHKPVLLCWGITLLRHILWAWRPLILLRPIAVYYAGELVALLEYLGILSGISHEVLGMTVLAWGNSVGDLSTNSAMAKRGLSNMAMTACFAGPIINILVSLGLGFMQNLAVDHSSAVPVQLQVCLCSLSVHILNSHIAPTILMQFVDSTVWKFM